jgi:glycosyltransferase involved in cell wall biosynthesis
MASGLPCVSHDVGDIGWMLGDGGVIAPHADPETFGKILADLVRDPERRALLGRRARERVVNRFTWERSVDYLEEAYYAGVAKKAGTGRLR